MHICVCTGVCVNTHVHIRTRENVYTWGGGQFSGENEAFLLQKVNFPTAAQSPPFKVLGQPSRNSRYFPILREIWSIWSLESCRSLSPTSLENHKGGNYILGLQPPLGSPCHTWAVVVPASHIGVNCRARPSGHHPTAPSWNLGPAVPFSLGVRLKRQGLCLPGSSPSSHRHCPKCSTAPDPGSAAPAQDGLSSPICGMRKRLR